MKKGKNSPEIGDRGKTLFWGMFFLTFIPGAVSGPVWFPFSGRRPETYFLVGRLDRKSNRHNTHTHKKPFPNGTVQAENRNRSNRPVREGLA